MGASYTTTHTRHVTLHLQLLHHLRRCQWRRDTNAATTVKYLDDYTTIHHHTPPYNNLQANTTIHHHTPPYTTVHPIHHPTSSVSVSFCIRQFQDNCEKDENIVRNELCRQPRRRQPRQRRFVARFVWNGTSPRYSTDFQEDRDKKVQRCRMLRFQPALQAN